MKILKADFHFLLPDNFQGSLADALRLLADFVDAEQEPRDTLSACYGSSWQQFLHNSTVCKCRFTGKTSLMHLPHGQPWEKLPQRIACAHHDETGAAWIK